MKFYRYLPMIVLASALGALAQQSSSSADQLLVQARTTYEQQGAKPAIPLYEQALSAFREKGDRHGEAVTLGLLGNCYKHMGESQRALELLESALRLKHEL